MSDDEDAAAATLMQLQESCEGAFLRRMYFLSLWRHRRIYFLRGRHSVVPMYDVSLRTLRSHKGSGALEEPEPMYQIVDMQPKLLPQCPDTGPSRPPSPPLTPPELMTPTNSSKSTPLLTPILPAVSLPAQAKAVASNCKASGSQCTVVHKKAPAKIFPGTPAKPRVSRFHNKPYYLEAPHKKPQSKRAASAHARTNGTSTTDTDLIIGSQDISVFFQLLSANAANQRIAPFTITWGTSTPMGYAYGAENRVFAHDLPMDSSLPRLYKCVTQTRKAVNDAVVGRDDGSPSFNEHDLYTPRLCKGSGQQKAALCHLCTESPRWFFLKNSAYVYHMSTAHGISNLTTGPFYPPIDIRLVLQRAGVPPKILSHFVPDEAPVRDTCALAFVKEGKCHACGSWIPIQCSRTMDHGVPEIAWWKHAKVCHRHVPTPYQGNVVLFI